MNFKLLFIGVSEIRFKKFSMVGMIGQKSVWEEQRNAEGLNVYSNLPFYLQLLQRVEVQSFAASKVFLEYYTSDKTDANSEN